MISGASFFDPILSQGDSSSAAMRSRARYGAVGRGLRAATHFAVCLCFFVTACFKHVPIVNPTEGQRISLIRLTTGAEVKIQSPNVGRWEADSVVVRNSVGAVVQTYRREDIAELQRQQIKVLPTIAITVFALTLGLFLAGGASVDPYSGSD
jgi:hypothetical protein